jgi:hypothetical protein
MPVLLKDGKSVLFVHVPKAGGSSVEALFADSGWLTNFRYTPVNRPRLFPLLQVSPQHYHAALLREILKLDDFDLIFMITRDPIERFRSEFAMRHADLTRADAATVEEWADTIFERYAENPYVGDNHLRPQVEFLVPNTVLYRMEDGLGAMVKDLNSRFGLELHAKLKHRLHSKDRGLSSSRVEISKALRSRLVDFYAADFERFGYSG